MMRFITPILVLLCVFAAALANAADREHQIKAAFIFNFAKFITWPSFSSSGAPIVVGIYKDDEYTTELIAALNGKSVLGHSFVVRKIDSEEKVASCDLAVIGEVGKEEIGHLARMCKGTGTVLVGDGEEFARAGGTIGFVLEANRIRFDINLQSAKAANVSISSKLLSLARTVYQ
jgi:YfiR/HmsC-like